MKNFSDPGLNNKNIFQPQNNNNINNNQNYNNNFNNIDTSSKIRANNINNNYANVKKNS
jgi:hypothetical protein